MNNTRTHTHKRSLYCHECGGDGFAWDAYPGPSGELCGGIVGICGVCHGTGKISSARNAEHEDTKPEANQ